MDVKVMSCIFIQFIITVIIIVFTIKMRPFIDKEWYKIEYETNSAQFNLVL
jgi:hypothetical protein